MEFRDSLPTMVEEVVFEDVAVLPPFLEPLSMLTPALKEGPRRLSDVHRGDLHLLVQLFLLLASSRMTSEADILVGETLSRARVYLLSLLVAGHTILPGAWDPVPQSCLWELSC